ncbi:MAG: phytanoyl-CoA dioxygenase family protein [Halobacteriaceae archaeon]
MLSESQKREFVRDGFLVVEDGVESELVDEGRELIWEELPEDPDDVESLVGVGSRSPDVSAEEPFATINERLYEHAVDLVGDALVAPDGPGMQFALRYPKDLRLDAHHDRRPNSGHLDGYGPGFKEDGQYSGFAVAAVVYFDDVSPRGGGFTVWPGSHWVAADYFRDHALNTPGLGGDLPAIDDDGDWDSSRSLRDQLRSRSLAGDAGTVVLWHNKLVHTAGVNQSDAVRMAGITRMSREDQDEIREDAKDKPFEYWDGLDGVEPAR